MFRWAWCTNVLLRPGQELTCLNAIFCWGTFEPAVLKRPLGTRKAAIARERFMMIYTLVPHRRRPGRMAASVRSCPSRSIELWPMEVPMEISCNWARGIEQGVQEDEDLKFVPSYPLRAGSITTRENF